MRHVPLVLVSLTLLLSWGGFALVQRGNAIRTHRLSVELVLVVPELTDLVASYTESYRESGVWADPANDDDATMRFVETWQREGRRVDVYELLMLDRRLEVEFGLDGSISARVVEYSG